MHMSTIFVRQYICVCSRYGGRSGNSGKSDSGSSGDGGDDNCGGGGAFAGAGNGDVGDATAV